MAPFLLLALARFAQTSLTLDVSVEYDKRAVRGRASITAENRGEPNARELSLLLNRLMHASAVSAGGKPLRFEQEVVVFSDEPFRQVTQLRVALPKPLAPGERATVDVDYAGPLVGYVETGSLYIRDRVDPDFTILRRDAFAFPVLGVPSRAANRALREPDFSFDATVRVPPNQRVAAGGVLVSRTDKAWHFRAASAPYLNVAIAPYALRESGGIRVYALPADAATAEPVLDSTRKAMALLTQWFGSLDREPALSIAEIPAGFGSQASLAGGIIADARAFNDVAERRQLYHELSHIWNPPDLDQPSPRWTEGLATWLEYRLAREIDGYSDITGVIARTRRRMCEAADRLRSVPMRRYGEKDMTDYSYSVGFLMFAELDGKMGTAALDAALRRWFQEHQRGSTSEDLRDALAQPLLWEKWMTTSNWLDGCGA